MPLLAGGALLVCATLAARMLLGAYAEIVEAGRAAARADGPAERRHLRRAMAYYLPGNPYVTRARDLLLERARQAEARGDRATALAALTELRSAILALRGMTRPHADVLPEVDRRLAALLAGSPEAAAGLRTPAGRAALEQRLAHPPEPHPAFAALALVGFLGWVGGGFALIARGLGPDAAPRRALWPLAGLVVAALGVFCLGLALA
jgi:hypothetical protein